MREERAERGFVHGERCPCRVRDGLPCPGRLLVVRDSRPAADAPPVFRCNGPDAHEVRVSTGSQGPMLPAPPRAPSRDGVPPAGGPVTLRPADVPGLDDPRREQPGRQPLG